MLLRISLSVGSSTAAQVILHLAVAALPQAQFNPAGGRGSPADRRCPFLEFGNGIALEPAGLGGPGQPLLNHHTVTQLLQLLLIRQSLHLRPVAPPVSEQRIGQLMLQAPVTGRRSSPSLSASRRPAAYTSGTSIQPGIPNGCGFSGELAEHAVRLVQ